MECPKCGEILTEEMEGMGVCFYCGCNIQEMISEKLREQEARATQSKYRSAWFGEGPEDGKKYFQYKTVAIPDKADGRADVEAMEKSMNELGLEGWRLVNVFSNEIGKNSEYIGMYRELNATIDETVLIFERIESV